jgi:hypothetical protein
MRTVVRTVLAALFGALITAGSGVAAAAPSAVVTPPPTMTWSVASVTVPGLTAVSCPVRGFCVAVSSDGDAVVLHGTTWSAPRHVASALTNVSCPTATYCLAVNSSQYVIYNSGHWTPARPVGAYDISCPTTVFCLGVSQSGTYQSFDGSQWSAAHQVPGNEFGDGMDDVTCPSSGFCIGDDVDAVLYGIRGAMAGPGTQPVDFAISEVTCTSTTFCAGLDANHPRGVWRENSSPWTRTVLGVPTGYRLTDVACTWHGFCAAVDNHGDAFTAGTSSFSAPHRVTLRTGGLSAIDCVSSYYCVAVGPAGRASIGTR